MLLGGNKLTIVTHNGSFHADDVFACAALSLWAKSVDKEVTIIRTRDPVRIGEADIVVDVGNVYDSEKNRFDHHQRGGAGEHDSGIPYAAFGLVWKKFGVHICGSSDIAEAIERKLVLPVDARDNGITINHNVQKDVSPYTITWEFVVAFRATWQDPAYEMDANFIELVQIVERLLVKEIHYTKSVFEAETLVRNEIKSQSTQDILILSHDVPWDELIANYYKNIRFVVFPEPETATWCVETPRDDFQDYATNRALFPEERAGLRDAELARVSGIHDAIFCHRGRFFAVTKSQESAITMAKKALGQA